MRVAVASGFRRFPGALRQRAIFRLHVGLPGHTLDHKWEGAFPAACPLVPVDEETVWSEERVPDYRCGA
jgi:hypothetical protein